MNASSTPPTHTISLHRQIYCFKISDFEGSANVFCAALENKVVLGLLHFPEETESDEFQWEKRKELHHDTRCHAIAFSPETSLLALPKVATFCTAGADFRLRVFRSNLEDSDTVQILDGHTGYINDVAFEPATGKYLASVSDDHSCKIRSKKDNFESQMVFRFKSPTMAVCWHPDDSEKLLVAEKRGTIHLYNLVGKQITLSIETNKAPLMSADWCSRNRCFVTALVAGEVIAFDLRYPYRPTETRSVHEDGGSIIKYSPNSEFVVASIGRPNNTLKVIHLKSEIPHLVASLKLFGGLCWYQRLSYICAADDDKLCFWKVNTK